MNRNITTYDIKTLRNQLGLSQREFADKLGASQKTVWFWESGKSEPNAEYKEKLTTLYQEVVKNDGEGSQGGSQKVVTDVVKIDDIGSQGSQDDVVKNDGQGSQIENDVVKQGSQSGQDVVKDDKKVVKKLKTGSQDVVNFDYIPIELREFPHWVCWGIEIRDGEETKPPYSPHGGRASTGDPTTWGTFEQAQAYLEKNKHLSGLGFVFSDDDPFCGIDLDKCREPSTGKIDKEAQNTIDDFASYTEKSPSEEGTHIIIKGKKKGARARKGNIEIYDTGRYFTMTGNVLNEHTTIENRQEQLDRLYDTLFAKEEKQAEGLHAPRAKRAGEAVVHNTASAPVQSQGDSYRGVMRVAKPSADDQSLIEKAKNAQNGAKFTALWGGDITGYDSQSEADLALCSLLAFWTQGDEGAIDRLFRQSGLYREKWEREDYRNITIETAIADTDTYDPQYAETHGKATKPNKEEYKEIINTINAKLENTDDLSSIEQSELIQDVLEKVTELKKSDQARYIKLLSETFGIAQKALKDDMKEISTGERPQGRHFGDIYEIDGYDANGNRQLGYLKVAFPVQKLISTFIIKPESKLWIDGYEAINATFISENKEFENIVIERRNWNSPDSFMDVIPSTQMVWKGEGRADIQSVMAIVSSYDVPTQVATKQIGWHTRCEHTGEALRLRRVSPSVRLPQDKIWVGPNLNLDTNGLIEPEKIFYYPVGGHNLIDDIVSYAECDDTQFAELQAQARRLLELNEPDVMIPIIGWFHSAFTKRWWLNHPNIRHFSHLNVAGSRGSGKSTIIEVIWQVFGWTGDALPNCSASRFALLRTFSSTNSFPIALDEFKPSNMPKDRVANLREFMRHSYGGVIDQRGRPDQSIVEYHLTAPVCLIGEMPYYPLEAAAIERVIPVHTNFNAITPETEQGEQRSRLCHELQQVDWTGYLPRYIRYLVNIDFETQLEYAHEDATRYIGERDVPRRIWDNIAVMIFGLRQYENFAYVVVDDDLIGHAVQTIVTCLCGEAGNRGKLAFEMALEQMAVMAEVGRLKSGMHYLINENNQLCLRLSACLSEFRRFARETNWTGEVLDDNAYRRQITEIYEEGRLIAETTHPVRGWQGNRNNMARAVIIKTNDENIDLSGFLLQHDDWL